MELLTKGALTEALVLPAAARVAAQLAMQAMQRPQQRQDEPLSAVAPFFGIDTERR